VYFPFFQDISGKRGVIVGNGAVAKRKIKSLRPFGPELTVVDRPFVPADLEGADFVIAATDDRALNREIARLCRARNTPVNSATSREDSTFLFPALVRRGEVCAGISTGGENPAAAACLRGFLDGCLPRDLDLSQDVRPSTEHLESRLQAGKVFLIGAGCGEADLITLRGLARLRSCQAAVYDDLIDPELLEYLPENAEKICMGKRAGRPSPAQAEINRTLVELARRGLRVARLKGGDPFVFGRGGEEALALREAGIDFEVVPGISSAIAVPAAAGIPVTHRGVSRSFHVLTGHTAQGLPEQLDRLAGLDGTLVILMGLENLPQIARKLMDAGKAKETPAAVLAEGTAVRGTLEHIAGLAEGLRPPAVIVIGETAALVLRSNTASRWRSETG